MLGDLEQKMTVITGPMYSAKTTELISRVNRYTYAGCTVQYFRPGIDDRYSDDGIATHQQASEKATLIADSSAIVSKLDPAAQVIGIDEVQFLDSGIVSVAELLRQDGKAVYLAGLNMDFLRQPFRFTDGQKHMGDLMVVADDIITLSAICQAREGGEVCGAEARYSCRISGGSDLVEVGSEGKYIATCFRHHTIP